MTSIPWTSCLPGLLVALLVGPQLQAATPSGKTLAMQGNGRGAVACQTCHGQNGMGNAAAGYPYLAGLPAAYIENQLQAFSNGSRQNAVMKPMASALNRQEITALAGYYADLENPLLGQSNTSSPPGEDATASLVQDGKWQAGMPACYSCHGPQGEGVAPHFPPLVGQPFNYLKNQLMAWKRGERRNDPLQLMQAVVEALNAEEIDAIARYLAEQRPGAQ